MPTKPEEQEVQIIGEYCEDCLNAIIDESDKKKLKVHCGARNRDYIWGQCIPCNDKVKIK